MKVWTLVLATIVAVVAGLWFAAREGDGTTAEHPGLTLAVYAGDVSALAYLARDKGYFDEFGVDVTLVEFEAGKLAVDTLLAGSADVATAGELVFITNVGDAPDLRIFGTISDFRIDELIARRDRGIEGPGDLRGKKVGVLRKATSEFFLGRYLGLHGIDYEDVEVVDLTPTGIVDALLAGEIDAGQTWDPNVYNLKQRLGENAVPLVPGVDLQAIETFVLMAREGWLVENHDAAKRFLAALKQAERDVAADPIMTKAFIARQFSLNAAYVDYVYPKINFEVSLPQRLLVAMEEEAHWAMANGLIETEAPDHTVFFHGGPLHEIDPDSVYFVKR